MLMTDGQAASASWNKAPIWGLQPDFYYCHIVADLLMWGALSDERTGVSFTIAAGSRQRSHSRVRVRWDSRPYFTVSDLRLSFSSPPTTRRVTVEVFDPASTRDAINSSGKVSCCNVSENRIGDTPFNSRVIAFLAIIVLWTVRCREYWFQSVKLHCVYQSPSNRSSLSVLPRICVYRAVA
jgi:hypothetical protein